MAEDNKQTDVTRELSDSSLSAPSPQAKSAANDPATAVPEIVKAFAEKRKARHWRRPIKVGVDRIIELLLTSAIAYLAYSQVRIAKTSSESSGIQLGQIIKTAENLSASADRITKAASSFSESAAGINTGVGAAVDKLQGQAAAAHGIALATIAASKSAIQAAQIANKSYLYPIIGSSNLGAVTPCSDQNRTGNYHSHPTLYCSGFTYKNFGQTPAFGIRISGFVRAAQDSKPMPKEFPNCIGTTQEKALAKDAVDGCEMIALPQEDDEIARLFMSHPMQSAGYYVRGYIESDDIYQHHTKQPFCLFYPAGAVGIASRPRICRSGEDWVTSSLTK